MTNKMRYVYTYLLFPVVVFNLLILFLSVFLNSLRFAATKGSFSSVFNDLGCLVAWGVASAVVGVEIFIHGSWNRSGQEEEGIGRTGKMKPWYVPLFLLRIFTISLLFSLGAVSQSYKFLLIPIALVIVVYWGLVLFSRPYKDCFSNFALVLIELPGLYSIGLAVFNKYSSVEPITEAFFLFMLNGLIIIATLLSVVRIIRNLCRVCKEKASEENSEPKAKP